MHKSLTNADNILTYIGTVKYHTSHQDTPLCPPYDNLTIMEGR